jgi:integrase/recombinase XerD
MKYGLEHFIDYLTVECGLSSNTIDAYRNDIQKFIAFCDEHGIAELEDVDGDTIITFLLEEREKGHKESSVARNLVAVRIFFKFLFMNRVITEEAGIFLMFSLKRKYWN